jgi:purine-binding chemotaxis protein CheW
MTAVQDMTGFEALTLDMQGETFAVDAIQVSEILDMVPVTDVPNSQPFANGLINVRGKVVPLADLRVKFGMERAQATIDTRIVVVEVEIDGVPTTVGILADKVHEVTELTTASLTETPKVGMRWRPEFIRCVARHRDDFIIVLDLAAILSNGLRAAATDSAAA